MADTTKRHCDPFVAGIRFKRHHDKAQIAMAVPADNSGLNSELARKINQEARNNPESPFSGKFVAIAGGQVVALANDLDELVERLRDVNTDPRQSLCFGAGLDYAQVQEIWDVS
jgi:hypothetical protein